MARSAGGPGHGSQLRAPQAEPKLLRTSPLGRATGTGAKGVGGWEERTGEGARLKEWRGLELGWGGSFGLYLKGPCGAIQIVPPAPRSRARPLKFLSGT
jgi:hypothetical protein